MSDSSVRKTVRLSAVKSAFQSGGHQADAYQNSIAPHFQHSHVMWPQSRKDF